MSPQGVRVKNYETASKFVNVMKRNLRAYRLFSGLGV